MIFAPAIGIACLQVLGWLCLFVAALSCAVVLKQFVAPNEGFQSATMLSVAGVFGIGGLACRWGAAAIRRATGA